MVFSGLISKAWFALLFLFVTINYPNAAFSSEKKIRIAVVMFQHETTTFLPNETIISNFIYDGSPAKGDVLLNNPGINGFVRVAEREKDIELVGIESPLWPLSGSGSGIITKKTFEHFSKRIISHIKKQNNFDGIYLALHGAMAVQGIPRPEAELACRIRNIVGPSAFIVGTFDPHGNEDEQFFNCADLAFTAKYYPHYDTQLQGERAAHTLIRAIRGDYNPVQSVQKVPILTPTVSQWSGKSPWMDLIQRALIWESREADVFVNLFYGYPWSDVPDIGMTIEVITNGDAELAQKISQDMASTAWNFRERLVNSAIIHPVDQGVSLAKQAVKNGQGPVILADYSDRSGNATWALAEVVRQDLSDTVIATLMDKNLIEKLLENGVKKGDKFDQKVGGYADQSAGNPVHITGKILSVIRNDAEEKTRISIMFGRNNVLILSPYLVQVQEPQTIRDASINPDKYKIIIVKSRVHFRRGFDSNGYAKTILIVEPPHPFLGTVHLNALTYKNVDIKKFYPYGNVTYSPE